MKKLLIVAMIALMGFASLGAQTTNAVSTDVNLGFESEYIFRGVEQADNVIVGSVVVDVYNAYVGVATYQNVDADDASFDGEVDLYAGYLFDDILLGASIDVGTTVYWYPKAATSLGQTDYTVEPYVGLVFKDLILTPSAYAFYDIDRQSIAVEVSVTEKFVTNNSLPLLGEVTITPNASLGYADINDVNPRGFKAEDSYQYVSLSADASITVYEATVSVGPRYVYTDQSVIDLNDLSWGANVSYSF